MADVRMRSERMERIYRNALTEDQELKDAKGAGLRGFNPDKPWDYVFKVAANDKDFWDREVKEKVLLYNSNLMEMSSASDDRTGGVKFVDGESVSPDGKSSPGKRKPTRACVCHGKRGIHASQ